MKNNLSVALLQAGNAQAAYEPPQAQTKFSPGQSDLKRQAMAFGNQAAALEALKKLDQALEAYERSAALFAEAGETEMRSMVLQSAASDQITTWKNGGFGAFDDRLG